MRDPYQVLGVSRSAAESEIKSAYRDLAKRYHPDTSQGEPDAEDAFRDVNTAYSILKDKSSRRAYDRGDIDASGAPLRRSFHGQSPSPGAEAPRTQQQGDPFRFGFGDRSEFSRAQDMFSDLFGSRRTGDHKARGRSPKGRDVTYKLTVSFVEAVKGSKRRVRLPGGSRLDVKIPPGVEDGKQIRLKGQGKPSGSRAPAGDALITVKVEPHEAFIRDGDDIFLELPITVKEAVEGAKISVPTVWGPVTMTIPAGSNTGAVLRLRGKGVARPGETQGDQLVDIKVMLPENDEQFARLVADWNGSYNVRAHLEGL